MGTFPKTWRRVGKAHSAPVRRIHHPINNAGECFRPWRGRFLPGSTTHVKLRMIRKNLTSPFLLFLFLCLGTGPLLHAQNRYDGLWHAGNSDQKIWVNVPWDSFEKKRAELNRQGYDLVDIEMRLQGSERRYSGLFQRDARAGNLAADLNWDSFRQRWDEWTARGYNIVDVEIYNTGGENRFIGIWRPGTLKQKILFDADWEDFTRVVSALAEKGYTLFDMETYLKNGQRKYAGLFAITGETALFMKGLDRTAFPAIHNGLRDNGYLLIDMEIYRDNGAEQYFAVWQRKSGSQRVRLNAPWDAFWRDFQQLAREGYHLVHLDFSEGSRSGGTLFPPATPAPPVADGDFIIDPLPSTGGQPVAPPVNTPAPTPTPPVTPPSNPPPSGGNNNPPTTGQVEFGKASYYSDQLHGKKTASGEPYDRYKLTAAHRTLPFGTKVRVTHLANNKSVVVKINDRGPHTQGLLIDLSREAAYRLGIIQLGTAEVKIEVLK